MSARQTETSYEVFPVGRVEKTDAVVRLRVFEEYADALRGLDAFSHVVVVWWFHENDTPENRRILQVRPRRNPQNPQTGVFACRSPYRPNLIAIDVCKILSIEGTVIVVDDIYAFDGSPILDLKPYIPNIDDPAEAKEVRLAEWLEE